MFTLRKLTLLCLAALAPLTTKAQELFPNLLTPDFRGDSGTEYTAWDIFTDPYLGLNYGDVSAAASNPSIAQNLTSSAFLTSGFNIYSFAAATGFEIVNDTSGTIGALGTVVFQFDTLGTFIDYSTIKLNYSGGSIDPASLISESRVITGGFGGYTNRAAVQWNLTGLGITDYTVSFQSLGSSTSFNSASLDTSTTYNEVVPLARTFDAGGGTANWSDTTNWFAGVTPGIEGNINITAGNSLVVDGSHEVGQMTFSQSGSFALNGASTLTVNTGIELKNGTGAVTIIAPIHGGGHLFLTVLEGSVITLDGDVSGAAAVGSIPAVGLTKEGDGTAVISGDMTFGGGVAITEGTLRLSGNNTYAGSTSVNSGRLEVAANAPSGSVGALGNSTSTVTVGADPATYGVLPAAQLIIDGDHTVGRNISLAAGGNTKILGAANTTSEAVFSGNIALASSTANSRLRAEGADAVVRFSGNISGGSSANTLVKDGSGTVIFSGANNTYGTATTIAAGTLIIEGGSSVTGNGVWNVSSDANLKVDGVLGGSGSFTLAGNLSGSGTVSRTVTTSGTSSQFRPGNSPGTLTLGGLDASAGASFIFELGINSDLIDVNGPLTGSLAPGGLLFSFSDAGGLSTGVDYTLFNYNSLSGFDASDFAILTLGFSVSEWTIGNGLVQVKFCAVPEPSACALLVLGGLALAFHQRKKPNQNRILL